LISNTIRLSIFSETTRDRGDEARRRDELVRARSDSRGPVHGPDRRSARDLLPDLGKAIALPSILPHLSTDPTVHALSSFPLVALILLGMGLVLGAVGSGFTIRRFLRV
jgi:hypothetical protein